MMEYQLLYGVQYSDDQLHTLLELVQDSCSRAGGSADGIVTRGQALLTQVMRDQRLLQAFLHKYSLPVSREHNTLVMGQQTRLQLQEARCACRLGPGSTGCTRSLGSLRTIFESYRGLVQSVTRPRPGTCSAGVDAPECWGERVWRLYEDIVTVINKQ